MAMKKLLPFLLPLLGLAAGIGTALFLRGTDSAAVAESPAGHAAAEQPEAEGAAGHAEGAGEAPSPDHGGGTGHSEAQFEYVKMPQQFVVPVVSGSRISAMVVISLSLEIVPGMNEAVFAREPKLRDAFLQVMFLHAHSGGFNGNFTTGQAMIDLRGSLRQSAVGILGDMVNDVLVTDIVRQDT